MSKTGFGILGIALAALCGAGLAQAETSELRALMTDSDSRGWEAVGQLDIGGKGTCTGALIGQKLVLTAAHCVYDKSTGTQVPAEKITFLAGFRDGDAVAVRPVDRYVVHEGYAFDGKDRALRVATDTALLQLAEPIPTDVVQPFAVGEWPKKGDEIGVISYAFDRADRPSIQDTCEVLETARGALIMDCDVDFGSSGAPIFMLQWSRPVVVSVVSAKAQVGGQRVSLGTSLGTGINDLKVALAQSGGIRTESVTPRVTSGLPQVMRRDGGAASSAKFIRPGG